ncbi:MAG: hypothetical protein ABI551_03760 [Polyangiaceae bacterium]
MKLHRSVLGLFLLSTLVACSGSSDSASAGSGTGDGKGDDKADGGASDGKGSGGDGADGGPTHASCRVTGFEGAPTDFALPAIPDVASSRTPFYGISGYNDVDDAGNSTVNYATIDIDGDGKLDLVIAGRTSDPSIGKTSWKVYKGSCE